MDDALNGLWHPGDRDRRRARPESRGGGARLTAARAAGGARPPRLQLPLVLGARRRRAVPRRSTPTAGSACAENPVRLLQEASTERAAARRGRRRRCSPAPRALEAEVAADLARAARRTVDAGAPGRLLLRRVRRPRVAADLLRRPRRARRRHPQGGLRPRAAAGRGRPPVPPGLLPPAHRRRRLAARVLGRHRPRPPPRRARDRRRRRAAHDHACRSATIDVVAQIWRVDVGRVPLFLLDADRPENSPVARWITSRLYVGDPDMRLAQYVLLGVGGDAGARGARDRARASCTSTRATPRSPRSSCASAMVRAAGTLDEALEAARARTVFTTHTPVPGGQRHLPGRPGRARRCAPICRAARHRRRELVRRGRTNPDDDAEPFGVTQFALRTQPRRQRREPPPRRGRARDVAATCGPTARSTTCRSPTSPTACTCPTWLGAPMRALLDRHLGEGWLAPRRRPARRGRAVDDIPDEELWAVARRSSAPRSIEYVRDRARGRPARPRRAAQLRAAPRRRVRPRRADDRLRPPPGDLQAARTCCSRTSSARYGLLAGDRPIQLLHRRQGAPARRRGQAPRPAPVRLQGRAGRGRARRLPRRLRPRARPRGSCSGCDVWLNLPRPPLEASGTSGMKSVVNGGLQLSVLDGWWAEGYDGAQRLGAVRRRRPRPRRAGRAATRAELFRLLERGGRPGVLRARRRRHAARVGRRASARRCARTCPLFSAARMVHEYRDRLYGGDVVASVHALTPAAQNSRLDASAAPSESDSSFAQQIVGSIGPKPDHVPKPQSVPATTRSGPTTRRTLDALRDELGVLDVVRRRAITPGARTLSSGTPRRASVHSWACRGLAASKRIVAGLASRTGP